MPIEDMDRSEAAESTSDDDALFRRLKREFRKDAEHWRAWRKTAEEDYRLYAGDHWSDDDKRVLAEQRRPVVSMNRVLTTIRVVSGYEVGNRQEIKYIPRTEGDVTVNEIVTSAAKWFRDKARAERAESDAFNDALICGVGCLETRLEHENNPDGDPDERRIDPMEMLIDRYSTEPGFRDAKRVWRIRTMSREDAEEMFPDVEPELLHAGWANGYMDNADAEDSSKPAYDGPEGTNDTESEEVTIVECQWARREPFMRLATAAGEQKLTMSEWKTLQKRMKAEGLDPGLFQAVKQYKLVRYRTFLGRNVLETGPTPCPSHFSYQFITGIRDQANGTWFGLVRPMADPQKWMNKFYSQILHIINSNAKGGIMAPPGAFEDQRQAEESWARTDAITWVKNGMADQIQPKPVPPMPAGLWQMMQFSFDFVPKASGVNEELVGLRDANQPGVLEAQRKQSGMTILAGFFDSLTDARRSIGEIILYIIQNDIPDGRMIRIVGEEKEQNVPLLKDMTAGEYDIIVSEAPTTPNEKERTWALLQPMMGMLPPQLAVKMLKYSPLPEAAVQEITEGAAEAMQNQPPPPEQVKAQAAMQINEQKAQLDAAKAQQDMQIKAEEAAMRREEMMLQLQMEREKLDLERQKMAMSMEMEAQRFEMERVKGIEAAERDRMSFEMKQNHDMQMAERQVKGQADATKPVMDTLSSLMAEIAHLKKPRRVVRNETGRIVGVEVVDD